MLLFSQKKESSDYPQYLVEMNRKTLSVHNEVSFQVCSFQILLLSINYSLQKNTSIASEIIIFPIQCSWVYILFVMKSFLMEISFSCPLNKSFAGFAFQNAQVFFTINSAPLWYILPLSDLLPVEFHFRIKIRICLMRCGVVGKNLHICGRLFQHFQRRLGSRNWKKVIMRE